MAPSSDPPPAVVPSFVAKVARAKKHLDELECAITAYKDLGPCTVRQRVTGKRQPWCLEFVADPANTDIPIIAADAVYNLRSSLDHLMASMVPRKRRSSVTFPVMWEGVWEAPVPRENEQRAKDRSRWQSCVTGLPGEAVAILKSLQPPEPNAQRGHVNLLTLVNTLSNRDRHEKLPTSVLGVRDLRATWTDPDGTPMQGTGQRATNQMFQNQAEIDAIPEGAMDVEIQGVPAIALKVAQQDGYVEIPEQLRAALRLIEERIVPALGPFARV
jgi:hypothetical protein